ncbi:MAG: restriction endonuclease [Bacteroidales bacterium]|nr:restriction endonuclease [Bacteroidales bacterium]
MKRFYILTSNFNFMNEPQLIKAICGFFESEILTKHQDSLIRKHSKLSEYQINPILVKYLSQLIENEITPEGIAKALFYPRALGTSITGAFGSKFQKMLVELGLVYGSLISGMDIEYIDKIDNRRKYCQLKSGPNTINAGDVKPILAEFDLVANLARTNNFQNFNNNDLILGIIYGDQNQLSGHYLKINQKYPVIIGIEFWYHITGYQSFYTNLITAIDSLILSLPSSNVFQTAYQSLVSEIRNANII